MDHKQKEEFRKEEVLEYEPHYEAKNYRVDKVGAENDESDVKPSQCKKLVITELLSYYETAKTEQFIELYNSGRLQGVYRR